MYVSRQLDVSNGHLCPKWNIEAFLMVKEMKASMEELKRQAYHFMEKLLNEEYCAVWNEVVIAQCDTALYYDLNGRQ